MTDLKTLADLVTARAETVSTFYTYRNQIAVRPPRNYVVLLFGGGVTQSGNLVGLADTLIWRFRALCVGFSDSECLWVADQIRSLFTNWRPLSSPAASAFVEEQDDAPVLRDESMINDVRYSLTLRFRFSTPRSI